MMKQIILASQSPRRKQLLEWAEIDFDVVVSKTDESYPADLSVEEVAVHIAGNKAHAVRKILDGEKIIIAADTLVVLDNEIIGKPKDTKDAISILTRLSDKRHLVITGVVMMRNEKEIAFADKTEVWFHALTNDQIEYYVDKYKPYDKAGAYAIQEWIGVTGIKSIRGDFYNVMGLPVSRVVKELRELVNSQ
jgi:septum formation protein